MIMADIRPRPLIDRLPQVRGRLTAQAPLAGITWFRVGGPAEVMFRPADREDLQHFLVALPADVPVTVIGVGSNLLVRDGGVLFLAAVGEVDLGVGDRAVRRDLAGAGRRVRADDADVGDVLLDPREQALDRLADRRVVHALVGLKDDLALLAGAHMAGLIGALVAVPFLAGLWEIVRTLYVEPRRAR